MKVPVRRRPGSGLPRQPSSRTDGYDAFISYSHAVDRQLAPALQRALHQLTKPWYRARALRVFRDDASLSANPHLWQSIEDALDGSRFFVLLASPESARSPWVGREVQHWLAHKPRSNLLVVLTDGSIAWDAAAGDFDWGQTTALPRSLQAVFGQEPRWVDLGWARTQEHLSLDDPRFRDGVADLAAPLHGRPKDELFGEDVRQHRRTLRITRAAVASLAALALAASAAAVVAVDARNLARTRQRVAEQQQRVATARGLVAQADAARDSDPRTALLLGIAAQRTHPDGETQASLVNTLTATHYAATLTGHRSTVSSVAFAPDGRTLATSSDDRTVILWDLADRARPRRLGTPLTDQDAVTSVAFSPDGRWLATGSSDRTVILWDLADRARPRRLGTPLKGHDEMVTSVAFARDGRTLATGSLDFTAILWDLAELNSLRDHATERACALTQRGLDREEWARYVPGLPYERTCPS
jgi:hypothetical protein